MITYSKTFWGLHLLLRLYGSAIPRTLPFAIFSSALTALLTYLPYRRYFTSLFLHPYPYQLFAFIVGFALVFRTNFGYQRYMEGRTNMQAMTSALTDLCSRALAFEAASLSAATLPPSPAQLELPTMRPDLMPRLYPTPASEGNTPRCSLSYTERERRDFLCSNNGPMDGGRGQQGPLASPEQQQQAPKGDAAAAAKPTGRTGPVGPAAAGMQIELPDKRLAQPGHAGSPYSWRDAVDDFWQQQEQAEAGQQPAAPQQQPQQHPSPARVALPLSHLWQYLQFKEELLHLTSLFHALALQYLRVDWRLDNLTAFTGRTDLGEEVPPPPMDARGLEGYKSSWVDIFVLRGTPEVRESYNKASKLAVIGHISQLRKTLLRQQSEADPKVVTETVFSGLDHEAFPSSRGRPIFRLSFLEHQTGNMIEGGPERVYTSYNWIQLLLAGRTREGGLGWRLPAPITTTVFHLLSQCFASFEQCRKLVDTPFPFPWSQTIIVFLLIYSLTIPIMMSAYVEQVWLGVVLTFISVLTYWALNEVARDLEDPFIYDPNDLPLARHQHDFNKRILAASDAILYSLQQGGP